MFAWRTVLVSALLFPALAFVQSAGALTVETASSIGRVSVPPGAQRVSMLTLTLSASCAEDAWVNGVTLTHEGLGALADITGVYAEQDGRRVSRVRTFASREPALRLDFRSLRIPACGQTDLVIRANFSAQAAAAGEHGLALRTAADVDATVPVTVQASAPVPTYRTVGPARGTVTVTVLPPLNNVRYGDHRMIGRLRITVDSVADQELTEIVLTNGGSARDAHLQRIAAELRGQPVTRVLSSMDGDRIPLVFDPPLVLPRGGTWLLDLRANVRSGIRKTLSLTVEEGSDVTARPLTGRR